MYNRDKTGVTCKTQMMKMQEKKTAEIYEDHKCTFIHCVDIFYLDSRNGCGL